MHTLNLLFVVELFFQGIYFIYEVETTRTDTAGVSILLLHFLPQNSTQECHHLQLTVGCASLQKELGNRIEEQRI